MKNLEICKINYRKNTTRKTRYKIIFAGETLKYTSKITLMHFRPVPKLIAKHIIANNYLKRGLSKNSCEIIWKLSFPSQFLDSCKYELKNIKPNIKAIKYNITELYKRLKTKDYVVPDYKWMSSASGELFKDWKEVTEDIWYNIKHGWFPPVYVYNPMNFNTYKRKSKNKGAFIMKESIKESINKILFNICHTRDEEGFIVPRPHTKVFWDLAGYLYKKGW